MTVVGGMRGRGGGSHLLVIGLALVSCAWAGCSSDTSGTPAQPDAAHVTTRDAGGHDAAPADASTDAQTGQPSFVFVLDPGGPSGLALDQDYVYWTSYDGRTIQRASKADGVPELLTPAYALAVPSIDVDDTSVYFSAYDDSYVTTYVGTVPKAGGTITVLAPQLYSALSVRVAGGFVYWLNDLQSSTGGVARVPTAGGAVQALTPTTYVYDARLAVDDQYVYWTAAGDLGPTSGNIYRALNDGSGPVDLLVTGIDSPWGIVADASNLFVELGAAFADVSNGVWAGAVITLDKLGTPPVATTVLADDQAEPFSIAVDDTAVYWGDDLSGRIMKVSKTGGPAVVLASGTGEIESMAVDDQYVYWVFESIGNGYIGRVPKNP